MKKIIKFLPIILCILCLTGCRTIIKYKYIYPELPEFTVERPVNPTLDPIPEDSSSDDALKIMSINLIKLIDSNENHVLYEDAFLEFYKEVKQSVSPQELATGE